MAEVSLKTMWRQSNGIERLRKKARLPKPKITSAGCISMAEVFLKAMQKLLSGIEKPLKVAIPQPKTILAGCTKMVGALSRTTQKQSSSFAEPLRVAMSQHRTNLPSSIDGLAIEQTQFKGLCNGRIFFVRMKAVILCSSIKSWEGMIGEK